EGPELAFALHVGFCRREDDNNLGKEPRLEWNCGSSACGEEDGKPHEPPVLVRLIEEAAEAGEDVSVLLLLFGASGVFLGLGATSLALERSLVAIRAGVLLARLGWAAEGQGLGIDESSIDAAVLNHEALVCPGFNNLSL